MSLLPDIMVAPNGSYRTKSDHFAIPVTICELVATARDCFDAGAGAIHAHMRDEKQKHVLDAGLYQEFIKEMNGQIPDMMVQITTEAANIYRPYEQRKLVADVQPKMVSVALREMLSDGDEKAARNFYHASDEAKISVQHILYSTAELAQFIALKDNNFFPDSPPQFLFVLGRYTKNQNSDPAELNGFVDLLNAHNLKADWAICAFGPMETKCGWHGFKLGGKVRVGFENSLWNADGSVAKDNAERVREIKGIQNDDMA